MTIKSMKLKNNKIFLIISNLKKKYCDKTRPISRYDASVEHLA